MGAEQQAAAHDSQAPASAEPTATRDSQAPASAEPTATRDSQAPASVEPSAARDSQMPAPEEPTEPRPGLDPMRMPAYMFLAGNGKRVLRPGGKRMTMRLIKRLAITPDDDVVELGPGPGATMRRILAARPKSYTAVERDRRAAAAISRQLGSQPGRRCVAAAAEAAALPERCASVVVSEAMLTMQREPRKRAIASEIGRLLEPGGRWMIHELALVPDDIDPHVKDELCDALAQTMHVRARPHTAAEWKQLLGEHGFAVAEEIYEPLGLLEPMRLLRDERLHAAGFALRLLRSRQTRKRVRAMRRLFRQYRSHLSAIGLVVVRQDDGRGQAGSHTGVE